MYSCETSTMLGHKTSLILRKNHPYFLPDSTNRFLRNSMKFRCLLDQIVPKFAVLSSLSSVFTSGNVIALAATAGSSSVHSAVTVAITDVAVTAVAIASGACLSTKVDFLWPKVEEQPGSLILDGVDVTEYPIFSDAKVQKAVAFARKAHHGQFRKTGEPYLTHCIHTGKILAVLVPSTGKRAVDTVVAGILHDVVDDTCERLGSIEREFDADVAKLVAGVSKLSYINQLLRRHRRVNVNQETLGPEEADNLRVMLLGMVDDPRVVLIKLADRLHNMRTIYALPPVKAQAVAQETLVIWCSLASRLGLWALKAELEDLCFAVLQPQVFQQMRANLASMWSSSKRAVKLRRLSAKTSSLAKSNGKSPSLVHEESAPTNDDNITMKDLLHAVLPFDLMLDRSKRIKFSDNFGTCSETQTKPKVVRDAGIALASMVVCEEALEQELFISTSYVPGMEVTISSRLKSLYSIYSKMKRKDVGIEEIYDARALRVIVGDNNGTLHGQAVRGCYSLLNIVHRLWIPIDGEFDDYIVNPKPSGYQVSDEWWCEPGHGDWCTCLEKYTLCRDGMYHKQDQFERLLPTFIQVIDLTEQEETRYWDVVSAVFEGKQVDSVISNSSCYENPGCDSIGSNSMEAGINNKVHLLRTMLQWEEQLRSEAGLQQSNNFVKKVNSVSVGEVVVVCWPHGEIMRLRTGSTAADAARRAGVEGKMVSVNGHIVLPNTQLKDGDVVEIRT